MAGLTPAEPANTNEKFRIAPRNAMRPVNRPRIRQMPMTTSPMATRGPKNVCPVSRSHSSQFTYQE
jgi:hypothetical protein